MEFIEHKIVEKCEVSPIPATLIEVGNLVLYKNCLAKVKSISPFNPQEFAELEILYQYFEQSVDVKVKRFDVFYRVESYKLKTIREYIFSENTNE